MADRVRAIIIQYSKVLLIKRVKPGVVYWVIPGGGIKEGETRETALQRECQEELGTEIGVGELVLELDSKDKDVEATSQKESFYLCTIIGGALGSGSGPEYKKDSGYVGQYIIEWVAIKDLLDYDLKPEEVKNFIYKKYSKKYENQSRI
jgi:8-oxo-dGTP pyrophosphatase MutT (NUDIX family)